MPPKTIVKKDGAPKGIMFHRFPTDVRSEIQLWIDKLMAEKEVFVPAGGSWLYSILPFEVKDDPLDAILRAELLKDVDLDYIDLMGNKEKTGLIELAYQKVDPDGENAEVTCKYGSMRTNIAQFHQVFKIVHGFPTGAHTARTLNPKADPGFPEGRWAWVLEADKVIKKLEESDLRAQAIANNMIFIQRFASSIIGGVAGVKAGALYSTKMRGELTQANQAGQAQQVKKDEEMNLPLPHELEQNRHNLMEQVLALVPYLPKVEALKDDRPTTYKTVWSMVMANIIMQFYSYSDEWVLRSQNVYSLRIVVKGKEKPPTKGNCIIVDPANQNADALVIYREFKTAHLFDGYKIDGKEFEKEGFQFPINGKSMVMKAFWMSWLLLPNRTWVIPIWDKPEEHMTDTSALVAQYGWTLKGVGKKKEVHTQQVRTAKMNIQYTFRTKLTKEEQQLTNVQSFQTIAGYARLQYEKPTWNDDFLQSMKLTNKLATPRLMDERGRFVKDQSKEISNVLDHIVQIAKVPEQVWEKIILPTPMTAGDLKKEVEGKWLKPKKKRGGKADEESEDELLEDQLEKEMEEEEPPLPPKKGAKAPPPPPPAKAPPPTGPLTREQRMALRANPPPPPPPKIPAKKRDIEESQSSDEEDPPSPPPSPPKRGRTEEPESEPEPEPEDVPVPPQIPQLEMPPDYFTPATHEERQLLWVLRNANEGPKGFHFEIFTPDEELWWCMATGAIFVNMSKKNKDGKEPFAYVHLVPSPYMKKKIDDANEALMAAMLEECWIKKQMDVEEQAQWRKEHEEEYFPKKLKNYQKIVPVFEKDDDIYVKAKVDIQQIKNKWLMTVRKAGENKDKIEAAVQLATYRKVHFDDKEYDKQGIPEFTGKTLEAVNEALGTEVWEARPKRKPGRPGFTEYQKAVGAQLRALKKKISLQKAKKKYADKKKAERAPSLFQKRVDAAIKKEEERIKRNEDRVAQGLKPYPESRKPRGEDIDTDFYNMRALDPLVQKAVDEHFASLGKTTYIQKHRKIVADNYAKTMAARNND
jgi:hypothetical protein